MHILYKNSFKKSYKKRFLHNKKLIVVITTRIAQFEINPQEQSLRAHALEGTKKGYYSFSVTGDIRIIYCYDVNDSVIFIDIGTHNQMY